MLAFVILSRDANAFDVVFVASFSIAIMGLSVLALFVNPAAPGRVVEAATTNPVPAITALRGFGFGWLLLAASVLGLATSFWTRQLISSPTQISFSEGHAMA